MEKEMSSCIVPDTAKYLNVCIHFFPICIHLIYKVFLVVLGIITKH